MSFEKWWDNHCKQTQFQFGEVCNNTKEHVQEMIENGDVLYFQFNEKNYMIDIYEEGYVIQDPRFDEKLQTDLSLAYVEYSFSRQAKTPAELLALPFLDGKTIFERFEELKFFD